MGVPAADISIWPEYRRPEAAEEIAAAGDDHSAKIVEMSGALFNGGAAF